MTAPTPTPATGTGTGNRAALLVVDVQHDFCEGGALGVTGGAQVAHDVTALLDRRAGAYVAVVATRDHHDADSDNGGHFAAPGTDPDLATTWPVHCVAGTRGAAYADGFDTARVTHHVRKGMGEPAYSGFEGTVHVEGDRDGGTLAALLADLGVTDVDVVGIATDHCVKQTVLDALDAGLGVRVLGDLVAAVTPGTGEAARLAMIEAGACWTVDGAREEVRAG